MSTDLALPDQFHRMAMAYPSKVKAAIAKMETVGQAADGLAQAQTVAKYADAIKASTADKNEISYAVMLLAAKLGELCPAKTRQETGRGKKLSPAKGEFFHPNTLTAYRKLHTHQEQRRIDTYRTAVREDGDEVDMSIAGFLRFVGSDGNIKAHQNRGVIEWYTPAEYIEAARAAMGSIDLDPASSKLANKVVKAAQFFDKHADGLARDWAGNVFLNPPFKADLAKAFVHKLCESHKAKGVPQGVLLTNNNTDTAWWHEAAETCAIICFTRGRIAFYNPAGETAAPTNGHTLFYFGGRRAQFQKHFGPFGFLMTRFV